MVFPRNIVRIWINIKYSDSQSYVYCPNMPKWEWGQLGCETSSPVSRGNKGSTLHICSCLPAKGIKKNMCCDIFSDLQNVMKIVQRILTYSSPRFFKCQQLFFYLSIISISLFNLSSIVSSFPSSSSSCVCFFPNYFTSKL